MSADHITAQAAALVSPAELEARIDAATTQAELDDIRWAIVHLPHGISDLARRYGARRRQIEAWASAAAELTTARQEVTPWTA